MKIRTLASIGAALLCLAPAAAMAASKKVPTVQPSNGFVQDLNPEWASTHADSSKFPEEHRQYHRQAEAELRQWKADHSEGEDSGVYYQYMRIVMQQRNAKHRMWHMNKEGGLEWDYMRDGTMPDGMSMHLWQISDDADGYNWKIVDANGTSDSREYNGNMPSRRTLIDRTRSKQAVDSKSLGYQNQ